MQEAELPPLLKMCLPFSLSIFPPWAPCVCMYVYVCMYVCMYACIHRIVVRGQGSIVIKEAEGEESMNALGPAQLLVGRAIHLHISHVCMCVYVCVYV